MFGKRKKPSIELSVYLLCKNKIVKKYVVSASRKFNIGDETYVIKKECCYPRIKNKKINLASCYIEGNPNPLNLRKIEENIGLKPKELDDYIAGDVFNIIMECRKRDRTRYILWLAIMIFGLTMMNFIIWIITGA